ncbi:aldose 1-epimerase family protein [Cellulomonas sp. ATA003]|uniref:aldose 1-epimerase family protein n=1 Tax=Cellulomonas sp. ATA003 TaxID=3073064 RepID=UPI00287361CF|nr:aldose 1-epimerase family protein [Cellulomonas sp. ATA003]WNB86401.1 aldose 1-epimerase family protein [Cellulomonas sp. ATA003]
MTTTAPTGTPFRIRHGEHAATITEVGAYLREYRVGTRDVVHPFAEDAMPPAGNGAVLVPWPNRLRDGQYTYDGVSYQLPVTEPERGTALHGLALWQRWTAVEQSESAVTLELRLVPTPGYPFPVRFTITYALSDDGLRVHLVATNDGDRTAPYGVGFHPWLSPGGADLDDCTLRLDAATRVTVDDRLLPTGTEPASGPLDFRTPSTLRGVALDDAYVDVVRDEQGLAWIQLAAPDGRTAAVWMDGSMDTFQVCTGDELVPAANRTGLAAEPMSCIAEAFNTGERLVHLAPGARHEVTWGATLL